MTWFHFALLNVVTNGTFAFLIKRVSQKYSIGHVAINLVALSIAALTIAPFFLINLFKNQQLFTSNVGAVYMATSITIDFLAFNFWTQAISLNELSIVGPLDNLRPLFVVVFSLILLSQKPTLTILLGILLIIAGAFTLQIQRNLSVFFKTAIHSKATLYILLATTLFALSSTIQKKTLMYVSPLTMSFLGLTAISFFFALRFFKNRSQPKFKTALKKELVVGGVLFGVGSFAINSAFQLASPNVVVPIQMSRSLFVAVLGFIFLHEKGYLRKMLSAIIMIAGVLLLVQ